jgi:hypothetical protein
MNPLIQSKNTTILPVLIALTLGCFALSPQARAVCQEGCLPNQNTVLGDDALLNNTGPNNTAIGWKALYSDTTGFANTASGSGALEFNTTGFANTASGFGALSFNTTGFDNTASGYHALLSNTTGNDNTASGSGALFHNTTGSDNTATGLQALFSNTTGVNDTAYGFKALFSDTTGNNNTANGFEALFSNTTGFNNTATGQFALLNNTTGNSNIALGSNAGLNLTTGNNNIYIGAPGNAGESGKIRIGTAGTHNAAFIAGISGVTVAGGVGVIIGSNGKLGTIVSSERFKDGIKPMDKASEAILALKPVTFHYKHELDPEGIPQFGLVAEQVEKVNLDLVARDEQGKPYTVRYEAVNAMLLNEFLKAHRKMEKQEATITRLEKGMEALAATMKEQASLIQEVTRLRRVEVSEPAPQMVLDNR